MAGKLVLRRKIGERVVIDPTKCEPDTLGRITVLLLDAGGGWARLGFDAPEGVTVHRQEIQDQIDARVA